MANTATYGGIDYQLLGYDTGQYGKVDALEKLRGQSTSGRGSYLKTNIEGNYYDNDTGAYWQEIVATPPPAPAPVAAAPVAAAPAPVAAAPTPTFKPVTPLPTVTPPGEAAGDTTELEPVTPFRLDNKVGSSIGGSTGRTLGEVGLSPYDNQAKGLKGLTTPGTDTGETEKELERKRFGQGLFNIGVTAPGTGTGVQV